MKNDSLENELIRMFVVSRPISVVIATLSAIYLAISCIANPKSYYFLSEGFAFALLASASVLFVMSSYCKYLLLKYTVVDVQQIRNARGIFFKKSTWTKRK